MSDQNQKSNSKDDKQSETKSQKAQKTPSRQSQRNEENVNKDDTKSLTQSQKTPSRQSQRNEENNVNKDDTKSLTQSQKAQKTASRQSKRNTEEIDRPTSKNEKASRQEETVSRQSRTPNVNDEADPASVNVEQNLDQDVYTEPSESRTFDRPESEADLPVTPLSVSPSGESHHSQRTYSAYSFQSHDSGFSVEPRILLEEPSTTSLGLERPEIIESRPKRKSGLPNMFYDQSPTPNSKSDYYDSSPSHPKMLIDLPGDIPSRNDQIQILGRQLRSSAVSLSQQPRPKNKNNMHPKAEYYHGKAVDPKSGKSYYYNLDTGKRQWASIVEGRN